MGKLAGDGNDIMLKFETGKELRGGGKSDQRACLGRS